MKRAITSNGLLSRKDRLIGPARAVVPVKVGPPEQPHMSHFGNTICIALHGSPKTRPVRRDGLRRMLRLRFTRPMRNHRLSQPGRIRHYEEHPHFTDQECWHRRPHWPAVVPKTHSGLNPVDLPNGVEIGPPITPSKTFPKKKDERLSQRSSNHLPAITRSAFAAFCHPLCSQGSEFRRRGNQLLILWRMEEEMVEIVGGGGGRRLGHVVLCKAKNRSIRHPAFLPPPTPPHPLNPNISHLTPPIYFLSGYLGAPKSTAVEQAGTKI